MQNIILYYCMSDNAKETFNGEVQLTNYMDFDKIHREHLGYILIIKAVDKESMRDVLDKIIINTTNTLKGFEWNKK